MKIIVSGQYRYRLYKEFRDDYGNQRDVGQAILEELLRPYGGQEAAAEEDEEMHDYSVSPAGRAFLQKMKQFCDDHTFRYAKIDFLYWSEFQNRCSEQLQAFLGFLKQFQSNQDILNNQEAQASFVERLDHVSTMMVALFDMINCERCTSLGYFALMDDILDLFQLLLQLKIIAVEGTLAAMVDVVDSILAHCASTKQALKYGYKHEQIKAFLVGVAGPFQGQFLDQARQISKATNSQIEAQLVDAKVKQYKANNFLEIEAAGMPKYSITSSYVLFARLLQVCMSEGLPHEGHSTEKFEQELPPQQAFETLIETLTNPYLTKQVKELTLQVMQKLASLDMVRRFNYESARKNPYFMESVKYLQTYIDIFGKLATYHTETKLRIEISEEEKKGGNDKGVDSFEKEVERQIREMEDKASRKYLSAYVADDQDAAEARDGDREMRDVRVLREDGAPLEDSFVEVNSNGEAAVEHCRPEHDFIQSQAFLSDFIEYLSNIAKVRLRQVNQAIFPQIMGQIVSIISVKYDTRRQMYPVGLSTQSVAGKLLKDTLRSQQSFDDTQKLNQLIEKLKQEMQIIKVQSQVNCEEGVDHQKRPIAHPFHAKGKLYLRLYERSWPDDDDYLCKYQTLSQRQLLIKQLLRLLCFCIKRNDPNLVSYNQNFIAHSRKILESSIIQDDILTNIFKVHETLPFQQDKKSKDQIEETVSPLVLGSIQLVTQVFNDLPSKIQTFMQNGLFRGVITSLTQGGFPHCPDMINVLASFMHLLTLNQDARDLLIESHLITKFFEMCLQPEKYHRYVQARRADERTSELLLSVANCSPVVCNQIFEAFQYISEQILVKSKQLTHDYVAMDVELRRIQQKIKEAGEEQTELIQALEAEKNELKAPYELQQQNFENFFGSYVALFSSMFENDRENQPVSDHVQECMVRRKEQLLRMAYMGIQNPVVASALHQLSEDYSSMILVMVAGMQPEDEQRAFAPDRANELATVMKDVALFLAVQVKNLKILLKQRVDEQAAPARAARAPAEDAIMTSSLVEDEELDQIKEKQDVMQSRKDEGELPDFNHYQDLVPGYCKNLELFEAESPVKHNETAKSYAAFMNGDNNIVADDQATIVLRKIYFYAEMLIFWLQMEGHVGRFDKVSLLFSANPSLSKLIIDLFELSSLITKNRGINYSRTVREDQRRLEVLLNNVNGLQEKIESYNYDKNFNKQRTTPTSELMLGRRLYFKYKKNIGDVSLIKNLEGLQDTASVTNFDCDDTICTNAQATQSKIEKLLKQIQTTIRTGRSIHDLALIEEPQYEVCVRLGRSQIDECLGFIENGLAFLSWTEQYASIDDIPFEEMNFRFDNVLFDMISGLSQTTKMTGSNVVTGPTVDAFAQRINEVQLFAKLINFCTRITYFVESLLNAGKTMPLFRVSYIKVLWKDVYTLITALLEAPFIPTHPSHQKKFLLDIAAKLIRDTYIKNGDSMDLLNEKQRKDWEHLQLTHTERRFKNEFRDIHLQISKALFAAQAADQDIYMFGFLNKYCQKQFLNLAVRIFDQLQEQQEYTGLNKVWHLGCSIRFDFRYTGVPISQESELGRRQRQPLDQARRGLSPDSQNGSPPPNIFVQGMRVGSLGGGRYFYGGRPLAGHLDGHVNDGFQESAVIVSEKYLQNLVDMGFDKEDATRTLQQTRNHFEDALEQLIQAQKQPARSQEPQEEQSQQVKDGGQEKKDNAKSTQGTQTPEIQANTARSSSELDEKRKREQEIAALLKVEMPGPKDYKPIFKELKMKVFKQMLESKEENILYNCFSFDQETGQVYGYQVRLDLIFKQIFKLFDELTDLKAGTSATSEVLSTKDELQKIFFGVTSDLLLLEHNEVKREDLESIGSLKDLVIRLHVFQKLFKHHVYDNMLNLHGQQLSRKSIIDINMKILNASVQQLQSIFGELKEIKQNKVIEKAKMLQLENEPEEMLTQSTRTEREILTNKLPLLKSLIQMTQENLSSMLVDCLFDCKLNSSISLMQTVKDAPYEITKPTESDIMAKIKCIQEFQQRVKELFGGPVDDHGLMRQTLEQLMHSQIGLLKVYNSTPREFVNKKDDIHYPISFSLRLLRYIFQINDLIGANEPRQDKAAANSGAPGDTQNQSSPTHGRHCTLRKQFLQSDGLKQVFGVRVVDHFCENVEQFTNQQFQQFDQENQLYVGIVEELVGVLAHNSASAIRILEDQIKQLLFVQFKMKYKRETSKDLGDLLKPLAGAVGSKGHLQSHGSSGAQPVAQMNSPKPTHESKRWNQKGSHSQKKSNNNQGRGGVAAAQQHQENAAQNFQKIQQKQIKMLLKKHEHYNEVPLNPFLDFFLQNNSILPPVHDLDLFLMACKNTCVINVVDMPESEQGKIITIKLKSHVLRDLILESKASHESLQVSQAASKVKGNAAQGNSSASGTLNWHTEFKRQLPEVHLQHEIIQQLLDIFISQNKGHKMSILKQLKSGKFGAAGAQRGDEQRINFKDGKMILAVDAVQVPEAADARPPQDDRQREKRELRVLEAQEYLFDMHSILLVIANEIARNPTMIGSVLKHKDQKTFKYIIRNVIALKHLKIVGKEMQIVFQEAEEELGQRITNFFRAMLPDRHPVSISGKVFRSEARRVFIKEITKNIIEHDQPAQDPSPTCEQMFSSKLLQNYTSFLLLSNLLMTPELKPEHRLPELKSIHKSIRKYNHEQKLQLMIRILYETQLHQAAERTRQQPEQGGIHVYFFKQVQRMREEIQDEQRNLIITFKPKALSKTIEVVLQIINHFASSSEEVLAAILSRTKPKEGNAQELAGVGLESSLGGEAQRDLGDGKKLRSGRIVSPGASANKSSDGSSTPGRGRGRRAMRALSGLQRGADKEGADNDGDDVSLTIEDRREIEQLRKDERRSQLENAIAQLRETNGVTVLDDDEEGEDDDDEDDDDDFSDSYDIEAPGDLDEEGEHDISGALGGGSRGLVDRRSRSIDSQADDDVDMGLFQSDDFGDEEYDSDDDLDDLDEEGAEEDEQIEDEVVVEGDLLQYLHGHIEDYGEEYDEDMLLDPNGRARAGANVATRSDVNGSQDQNEDDLVNIEDLNLRDLDDSFPAEDEEAEATDGEDTDEFDSYDDAANDFDDEEEDHGGHPGGQVAEVGQLMGDFGEHGPDGYVHYLHRGPMYESSYEDVSESSLDQGYDPVRSCQPSFEDQLKIQFISARPHGADSIMHPEVGKAQLIELYQNQQEFQQEQPLGSYCHANLRPSLRRDLHENDWNSSQHPRKNMVDTMKSILEKLCQQLSGPDGVAWALANVLGLRPYDSDAGQASSWAQLALEAPKRVHDYPNYEEFMSKKCQLTKDVMQAITAAEKEKLRDLVSMDDWMLLYVNLIRVIKAMRDLADFELRMDPNLYTSNMININEAFAKGPEHQSEFENPPAQDGAYTLAANLKSSLADAAGEGGKEDGSNNINRSADTQSAVMNPQSANQADQAMDSQDRNGSNDLVRLEGTQSYEEFKRALRIVAGEESPTPELKEAPPAQDQAKGRASKSIEDDQIDSSTARGPQKAGTDTFDFIDPLFTQALNQPSIQAIKEGDQLIKKIQLQSSLQSTNKPYVQTTNDFLKKQTPSVRQQLLKNLGQHVLTHLSSDLFMEARRLRPPQNAQQRIGGGAADQGQHQRGRAPTGRHGRLMQAAQVPQAALASLAGQRRPLQDANAAGSFNPAPAAPTRDRLVSTESDLLQIGEQKKRTTAWQGSMRGAGASQLRDSESEEINVPAQRLNLTDQAFYLALHTFMQETREQFDHLVIRDQIRQDIRNQNQPNPWRRKEQSGSLSRTNAPLTHIITNSDLTDYCEHLIIGQFKEYEATVISTSQEGQTEELVRTNVKQIVGLLDIAVTEMRLLNKANQHLDHGQLDQQKSKRLSTIIQVPNFRLGMIVKLIQIMNTEIAQLMDYIEKFKALTAGAASQPFLTKKAISQKLPAYKGCTKVWATPQDTEAKILTPKWCLSFFLKSIYEIQNLLFDKKGKATTNGLLDLLKAPSSDPNLKLLYRELGLDNSFKMLDKDPASVEEMSLLDQILQMIADCILLTTGHPDAFDFSETQEKEFNKWKLDILQNLCRILQQIDVSLNIVGRKMRSKVPSKQEFRFSLETLNKIFKILFFAGPDSGAHPGAQVLDNSQRSIAVVSKVLTRISVMPLQIPDQMYASQRARTSSADVDQLVNLLKLYQTAESTELGQENQSKPTKQQITSAGEDEAQVMGETEKPQKSSLNIVTMKIAQILSMCMQSFHDFFRSRFEKLGKEGELKRSVLSSGSKQEKTELTQLIEKILHVFKISVNLAPGRGGGDQQEGRQESHTMLMLQEDEQLNTLLHVVQMVIDNEEQVERERQSSNRPGQEGLSGSQAFLYKEEFKLILQLVFTLSQYDLKHSKITAAKSTDQEQQDGTGQADQGDQAQGQVAEQEDVPPYNFRDEANDWAQQMANAPAGRNQRRRPLRREQPPPVSFQTADEIRQEYDPTVLKMVPDTQRTTELEQLLAKFKQGRTQDLVRFFYTNKRLLNRFIQHNQSAATVDHFLNFVIQLPQILDFESKRLLWRLCIKKHLRKSSRENGEYEIDIQIRRNQVFADSFEQLKDIQLESWKQKFTVEFHDEEGVDEGGLLKEWFELISKGIFDPDYALFQHSAQGSTYYPNPNAEVHDDQGEMIAMFKFVGRIIGKALNEGQLLDCYFVRALYKMMLGQQLELSDLQDFDEQVYKSLIYMLENDAEVCLQTFILSSKYFDEDKDVELVPGGKDIEVTNENKFEYCQKVLEHRLYRSIKTQIEAFLQGFRDLVPTNLLQIFDYKELELMLSGLPTVDIEDLKENVIYKNYTKSSAVILWLWEVLEELNNSERAEFIQFVTASSKVPVEGFRGLRGSNGQVQKVEIIKLNTDTPDKRLPLAHTCFFQLDLPEYSSKEILREKLLFAIQEGKTFNIA